MTRDFRAPKPLLLAAVLSLPLAWPTASSLAQDWGGGGGRHRERPGGYYHQEEAPPPPERGGPVAPLPRTPNLLANPGAEKLDSDGALAGWTAIEGQWKQNSETLVPPEGRNFFYGGSGARSELGQRVDVSYLAASVDQDESILLFQAAMASYADANPPHDQAEVRVHFLDEAGELIGTYSTGPRDRAGKWERVFELVPVPAGTRWLDVRLVATRRQGKSNDGYFDDLSLSIANAP